MKKRLILFLFTMLTSVSAWAEDFVVDGIRYETNYWDKTTVSVISNEPEYEGDIVIPESVMYDGTTCRVTGIDSKAFYGCSGLTSINIPDGVTGIVSNAFRYCSSLMSIIVDPNNANYDSRNNCNAIIEKSSNTLIAGCNNTIIPESVTSIGSEAFLGRSGLTSITIPESVKSIEGLAFNSCSGLTSITIPESVTSIGDYAFVGCSGLTSIVVDPNNVYYDSRNNCNAIIEKSSNTLILGCQNTTIPQSVTSIGEYAFYGCSGLTSVSFPSSLVSIGNYAFNSCSDLMNITIPKDVMSVGDYAFGKCDGLTSVIIANGLTRIGECAFEECDNLKYNEYDNALYLGNSENPYQCLIKPKNNDITSCIINDRTIIIEDRAFYYCPGLTSVTIPNGMKNIGDRTFDECDNLKYNEYDNALYLGNSENPYQCLIKSKNNDITSCIINDRTIIIGYRAFYYCPGLTSITIPESVTSIGNHAFESCSGLTNVDIPSSVVSIGDYAFFLCGALESIIIPDGVTSVGDCVFELCSSLTSLTIPSSVTSIGDNAFGFCNNLTSLEIPNSVTSIGQKAFYYSGLTNIIIPNSVTSIGDETFSICSDLTSVTIPSSVICIGDGTFSSCSKLDRLICLAAFPPTIGYGVFYESKLLSGGTVYIPKGTMAIYQEKWGTELNYVEMPSLEGDEANDIEVSIVDCSATSVTVKVITRSPIDIEIIVNGVKITNLKALSDVSAVRNADGTYTINGVRTGDVIKFVAKNNATAIEDVTTSRPTIEGIYNLQGQKLSVSQRGVNIINGKKVIVK